jgi:hypothetical protein
MAASLNRKWGDFLFLRFAPLPVSGLECRRDWAMV